MTQEQADRLIEVLVAGFTEVAVQLVGIELEVGRVVNELYKAR